MAAAPVVPVRPRRFRLGPSDGGGETAEFLEHLDRHGYAVVAAAADPAAVEEGKALMWDFLEGPPRSNFFEGLEVHRDDVASWGNRGWLGSRSTGVIHSMGVGQAPFMWHLRMLPAVSEAFAAVWGVPEAELLTSFDGANVFRPWQYDSDWRTKGGWYHVDQNGNNPNKQGRCCVQGLVSLTQATVHTGGLVVVPGSHHHFRELCERNAQKMPARFKQDPADPDAPMLSDFVSVAAGDPVLAPGGQLVCCEAGDLVLWDSRTVHCNTPALTLPEEEPAGAAGSAASPPGGWAPIRMVGYVCMTPAAWATEETLRKRLKAYINHQTTSHWPHTFTSFTATGPLGAAPSDPAPNDPANISDKQRRLISGPPAAAAAQPPATAAAGVESDGGASVPPPAVAVAPPSRSSRSFLPSFLSSRWGGASKSST